MKAEGAGWQKVQILALGANQMARALVVPPLGGNCGKVPPKGGTTSACFAALAPRTGRLQILAIPHYEKVFPPMEWNTLFYSSIPEGLLHRAAIAIYLMVVKNRENFAQEAVFGPFGPNAGSRGQGAAS